MIWKFLQISLKFQMFFSVNRTFFSHSRLEQFGNNIPFFTATLKDFSQFYQKAVWILKIKIKAYWKLSWKKKIPFSDNICVLYPKWWMAWTFKVDPELLSCVEAFKIRDLYVHTFVHFSDLVKMLPVCFFSMMAFSKLLIIVHYF